MRPFQHAVAGALQTEDGQTVVIQDGFAISYSELGCEGSEIDIDGVAHAIAPTADGFAGTFCGIEGDDNTSSCTRILGAQPAGQLSPLGSQRLRQISEPQPLGG